MLFRSYAKALYQRGFVQEGYKVINSLYSHCSNFEKSKIYPGVPEYIGDNGRGLYHYLTGAASWLLLTVLTEMFGVKGDIGNLRLDPKLTLEQFDSMHQASVELVFAKRNLMIQYNNKESREYGDYKMTSISIDGTLYKFDEGYDVIKRADIQALNEENMHVILVELK